MGPQVSIYDSDNRNLFTTWDLGNIQSQQATPIMTVYVWNNKFGNLNVSDLKNAYVTVVDSNGETSEGEVAKNKWVQVNIPSIDNDEITFLPIGGGITRGIKGGGDLSDNVLCAYNGSSTPENGVYSPDKKNVCKLNFIIVPPPNSTPGEKLFKIRIGGWFS